jgi:hypothetical protein
MLDHANVAEPKVYELLVLGSILPAIVNVEPLKVKFASPCINPAVPVAVNT